MLPPNSHVAVNINGTLNILEAAREEKIERVLVTSTSEVYGTALYTPINEAHPLQAQSPYSATKIGADAIAISYHKAFNLPVTVVRPFNTYGPPAKCTGRYTNGDHTSFVCQPD
jgi:nucleoside-diphosphate-sugar epimerase